ncbi:MAG: ABC transporter substrate-binding protein, partial [Microbacterium sp.]
MKHPQKFLALVAAGVATVVVLSGCSGSSDPSPSDSASETPVPGGEIVYGVGLDPVCVDPEQTNSHPGLTIARQVADSLLEQDPESGEYVGWLAKSWEVNEDATAYRFVLRDDVTFSDGTPLTSEAVQQNIESIKNGEKSSALAKAPFATYESFEKVSDQ